MSYYKEYRKEKARERFIKKLFNKFFNEVLEAKTSPFKALTDNRLSLLTTTILQVVSFFTTFAGIKYYFSNINLVVPYLIASVIQLLVLYLCNTATSKGSQPKGKTLFAIVMICISISFSYVGISNGIYDPRIEIYNTYQEFTGKYNLLCDAAIQDLEKTHGTTLYNDFIAAYKNIILEGENKIKSLEAEINNISNDNDNKENIQIKKTIDPITGAQSYTDKEILNESAKTDIKKAQESINQIAKVMPSSSPMPPKNDSAALAQAVNTYKNLYKILGKKEDENKYDELKEKDIIQSTDQKINIIKNYKYSNKSNQDKNTQQNLASYPKAMPAILTSLLSSLEPEVNDPIIVERNDKEQEMQDKIISLKSQITDNLYDRISQGISLPQALPNPYILPFQNLVNKNHISIMIFALILAILNDGLTFIIPRAIIHRRESALYGRSSKDFINEEESILESLFHSIVSAEIDESELKKSDAKALNDYSYRLRNQFSNILKQYISKFEPADIFRDYGFSLIADKQDVISEDSGFKLITETLIQLGCLKAITPEEYDAIKTYYFNGKLEEKDESKIISDLTKDNTKYIMRTNFSYWYTDTLSALSQYDYIRFKTHN